MRTILAASLLLLLACGGGDSSSDGADGAQVLQVRGLSVVVRSDAPFTRSVDFPSRLESTAAVALQYWGGSWSDLEDRTLTFTSAQDVGCSRSAALGCFDGDLRVSTQDPGTGTFACLEQTALVHEIGHAVLGDPDHQDPRWMDLGYVAQQLRGRVGYTQQGVVDPCVLYVSVWQHPLGTP